MSENITIQIDGTPTALTVDKLNTKLSPSGSANWVPEDAFMVGTLKVQRNGTFKASDYGLFGFDKVLVENSTRGGKAATLVGGPHIGEIHAEAPAIKEGGKAILISDVHHLTVNKSDASRLSMMAEPLLTVEDITVTKKGTYTAYERGKYGFGEVTVNVPDSGGGGGGGGGEAGLPDEIRVTTPPTKTEYYDGDFIDYSGMVVKAYKNGNVWKNSDYPDGIIPLNELDLLDKIASDELATIYPVEFTDVLAPYIGDEAIVKQKLPFTWIDYYQDDYTRYNFPDSPMHNATVKYEIRYYDTEYPNIFTAPYSFSDRTGYGNYEYTTPIVWASVDRYDSYVIGKGIYYPINTPPYNYGDEYVQQNLFSIKQTVTYRGKTVYYNTVYMGKYRDDFADVNTGFNKILVHIGSTELFKIAKYIAWSMIYGDNICRIQWARPSDYHVLSANVRVIIDRQNNSQ